MRGVMTVHWVAIVVNPHSGPCARKLGGDEGSQSIVAHTVVFIEGGVIGRGSGD